MEGHNFDWEEYKKQFEIIEATLLYKMWSKINRDTRERVKWDLARKNLDLSHAFPEYIQSFAITTSTFSNMSFPRTRVDWNSILEENLPL